MLIIFSADDIIASCPGLRRVTRDGGEVYLIYSTGTSAVGPTIWLDNFWPTWSNLEFGAYPDIQLLLSLISFP